MRLPPMICMLVMLLTIVALVQPAAQQESDSDSLAGNDRFSLGIIVGQPTGLSAKVWLAPNSAVDAALAWNFQTDRFHFHADYLHHFFDAFDVAPDRLPIYAGVGGNLRIRGDNAGGLRSGVRVPLGVSFLSSELPIDAFAELVPGMRIIPSTEFEFWWGLGARYRF